jgi:hypothetical protein
MIFFGGRSDRNGPLNFRVSYPSSSEMLFFLIFPRTLLPLIDGSKLIFLKSEEKMIPLKNPKKEES